MEIDSHCVYVHKKAIFDVRILSILLNIPGGIN